MIVVCISKKGVGGSISYLLLYVNNMLITVKDKADVRKIKVQR